MPDFAARPLLFLDIDGPLLPFGPRPASHHDRRPGGGGREELAVGDNPLLSRLDPADGHRLLALSCELIWATSWMAEANEVISPRLGLSDLPVVDWPDSDDEPAPGVHWKTQGLIDWAAGRTFVWVDDEITDADRRWVSVHHQGRALLHRVDPKVGLIDADFTDIRRWLNNTPAGLVATCVVEAPE